MRRPSRALIVVVLLIAVFSSYIYLTTGRDISPGWTSPVKIYDKTPTPSILYYEGELWVAFSDVEEQREVVKVIHSRDGEWWSSPIIAAEESGEGYVGVFQLLKRPDGSLWLLWAENKKSENWDSVLYYSILENGTWGTPREILRLDKTYRIVEAGNTPGGGLVVAMMHEAPARIVVDGKEVTVSAAGGECLIQSSNEHFEWNSPYLLSESRLLGWADFLNDRNGLLWVIYGRSSWISFRTSQDGNTWSYVQKFPFETMTRGVFLQRTNGQFVFIFSEDPLSSSMSFSPNGLEWSHPTLVVRTGLEGSHPTLAVKKLEYIYFDATESDDGTLWGVCGVEDGIYLMKFSDEKYIEDLRLLRSLRTRNEAIFLSICLLVVTSWFLVKRSPAYDSLRRNPYFIHFEGYIESVKKVVRRKEPWVVFFFTSYLLVVYWMQCELPIAYLKTAWLFYSAAFWALSGFLMYLKKHTTD